MEFEDKAIADDLSEGRSRFSDDGKVRACYQRSRGCFHDRRELDEGGHQRRQAVDVVK